MMKYYFNARIKNSMIKYYFNARIKNKHYEVHIIILMLDYIKINMMNYYFRIEINPENHIQRN